MASLRNSCYFIVVSVAAFMLLPYALASLCERLVLRNFGNNSRSICEAGTVYGIYASDFQNEGYSENIYVSWCRAQMYQLCGTWSASYGRECVKEFQTA